MKLEYKNIDEFLRFYIDLYVAEYNIPISKRLAEKEMGHYILMLKAFIKGINVDSPDFIKITQNGDPTDKRGYQYNKNLKVKEFLIMEEGSDRYTVPEYFQKLRLIFPKGEIPQPFGVESEGYTIFVENGEYELPLV